MSQSLHDSKMENDVESYNARIDKEDKIYGWFVGILLIIGFLLLIAWLIFKFPY